VENCSYYQHGINTLPTTNPLIMALKCKVSTTKDSPLVKELYALFVNQQVMVDDKAAQLHTAFPKKFDEINSNCLHNMWYKTKKCS